MTSPGSERYIPIRVSLPDNHPDLLEGLDTWLRLGLISDLEVSNIAQRFLSCPVPVPVTETVPEVATSVTPSLPLQPSIDPPNLPIPEPVISVRDRRSRSSTRSSTRSSNGWVSQFLQSLMNEVSVVWLLFLGVFLVVVSSAVLAASQWRNFSPVGQYGILLTYTLAFVAASLWTGSRSQLQLTSRMLQVASLLIIPVNFWVMDGFRLLQQPLGIGFAAIAALVLSGATIRLLPQPQTKPKVLATILGLSWLHWGWGWPGVALGATYVGCIGTALVLFFQSQGRSRQTLAPAATASLWWNQIGLGDVVLPYAVLLLLFRAWIIAAVPVEQLGLAFGICGWLLCWLSRDLNPKKQVEQVHSALDSNPISPTYPQSPPALGDLGGERNDLATVQTVSQKQSVQASALKFWSWFGTGLLGCGWIASVWSEPPWQALIITGLGLWLLGDRLNRHRQPLDLVGIVVLGLVATGLGIELIPVAVRTAFVSLCTDWVGAEGMPEALLGVTLFPYLWGVLGLSARLRRWQNHDLMQTAQGLSWVLGVGLVAISLPNLILRSLALWLAFGTLSLVLQRKQTVGVILIYVTHLMGLAAFASTIGSIWPHLNLEQWSFICLGVMVGEWVALTRLEHKPLWQQSTWDIGLGLAMLGYLLGLLNLADKPEEWNLLVVVIPMGLTALAFWSKFRWTQQAVAISIGSAIAVQILTFPAPTPRLVGLGVCTALMVLNTVRWPNLLSAGLTIGFGLTFSYATTWEIWHDVAFQVWFNLSVIPVWLLFGLRHRLSHQNTKLNQSYTLALDGWAIALMTMMLGVALLSALASWDWGYPFQWMSPYHWSYPISSLLTVGALGYRYWQRPSQVWLVGMAGAAEVSLILTAAYFHQPLRFMAIATLGLGLVSLGLSQYWGSRSHPRFPWSAQVIPLGYVVLGWFFSQLEWQFSTGLFTLVTAGLAITIGRRHLSWKPLTVLGLFGISVGAYELLLYPMLRSSGGELGDAFLLFGALATAIAILQRVLDRWSEPILNLGSSLILRIFAHIHWGMGGFWLVMALTQTMTPIAKDLWGLNLLILGGYALIQGRSPLLTSWAWVYFGLAEIMAAFGRGLFLHTPEAQLLPWAAAIASGAALIIHSLPWQQWGWSPTPFGHAALVLPGLVGLLTLARINTTSLLLVSAFYAWMAFVRHTARLSYIGLVPANWAALRLLNELHLTSRVWGVSLVGLSLLFIAQIDPALRSPSQRELRHFLRCFAVGLISVTILYESDAYFWSGLLAIGLSLGLILLGLRLQVRAFLYVGTLTFIAKVLRIIWLFIAQESLVLWALGIGLGLMLIWIAATFEARRAQVTTLLQYWVTTLESWQ